MTLRADLDLSKEKEGFIFGVKGIEDGDGIVYAKVVSCGEVRGYSCEGVYFFLMIVYEDKCLLLCSVSCVDGDWFLWVRTGCHRGGE